MRIGNRSVAIAALATGALLATGGAPAVGTPHVRSATVATPLLTVRMSGKNSLHVSGPRSISAGLVDLKLIAGNGEQAFDIMRLHKGYTLTDFSNDVGTFEQGQNNPSPASLRALNRAVHHTTFYGGIDSGSGHKTVTGTVTLPMASTYYVFSDSNGPNTNAPFIKLTVTARTGSRTAPTTSGTQVATTAKRFTGPVNLPASGTIAFHNASTQSPHLLFLQHVKKGTTRRQVIKSFQSNKPGPELPGDVGADVLGMRHTMTLTYTLPPGDYAELCFFPDLKTGMPHAFMGMVRIVHLS